MAQNLKQLLKAIAGEADILRVEIRNLADKTLLSSSKGDQLEQNASIVGTSFIGDDSDKKKAVEQKILLNTSDGEIEAILQMVDTLTPSSGIRIEEIGNATLRIHITTTTLLGSTFVNQLKGVVSGGVDLSITKSSTAPFVFKGGKGKGFTSIGSPIGTGGQLATLVQ